ncbi:MAG TPA: hypothetical protein VGZ02_10890 [Candidatus Baltobacteraceae bacterium]|jgi:hypothetical protein|nr:hypothetical protein [Candidatus Baltobacteraceae bacterium]
MRRRLLAAALAAAMGLGTMGPALADGRASTRNIITLLGAAAAFLIPNYNHKLRERRSQVLQVRRRQAAYRDWYYQKYGYYPTDSQFAQWYKQTYGVNPQTS